MASSSDVYVVATTDEGTRRALREATRLTAEASARVVMLVPHVITFTAPEADAAGTMALTDRFRAIASEAGVPATVRVCLCRRSDDVWRSMMPGARVIVGGRRRRWWPTAPERLARRLRDNGHDVLYAQIPA